MFDFFRMIVNYVSIRTVLNDRAQAVGGYLQWRNEGVVWVIEPPPPRWPFMKYCVQRKTF